MNRRILLAFFAVIAIARIASADSPSVTAVLSNSEATVGETVDLQIKVTGPGDARPPEEISIELAPWRLHLLMSKAAMFRLLWPQPDLQVRM